jgi:hypothetical protein
MNSVYQARAGEQAAGIANVMTLHLSTWQVDTLMCIDNV